MTCRHRVGDKACSDYPRRLEEAKRLVAASVDDDALPAKSPDSTNYTVLEAEPVGLHLVMKLQYPNCKQCWFEGTKIMVFANVTLLDALKWRRIDPYFRAPHDKDLLPTEAPSPIARFEPTDAGWEMARWFAQNLTRSGLVKTP